MERFRARHYSCVHVCVCVFIPLCCVPLSLWVCRIIPLDISCLFCQKGKWFLWICETDISILLVCVRKLIWGCGTGIYWWEHADTMDSRYCKVRRAICCFIKRVPNRVLLFANVWSVFTLRTMQNPNVPKTASGMTDTSHPHWTPCCDTVELA